MIMRALALVVFVLFLLNRASAAAGAGLSGNFLTLNEGYDLSSIDFQDGHGLPDKQFSLAFWIRVSTKYERLSFSLSLFLSLSLSLALILRSSSQQ